MEKSFIPAAHYPILTSYFEEIVRPFAGKIWKSISKEIINKTEEHANVVDLGCGTGIALRLLHKQRPDLELTGFDIDHDILHVARRKAEGLNIRFVKASIDKLPIESSSADVVLSSLMFHHLDRETKMRALAEVKRILKSGKPFLLCDFSVPKRPWIGYLVGFFSKPEPEVREQIRGQLLVLGKEVGASVETLWTLYGCVSLHRFIFLTPMDHANHAKI